MHRLRIGLDYRPALLGRSGIPRAVRELGRALAAIPDLDVRLFGHSWARARRNAPAGATLHRLRLPGRALPGLAKLGLDAAWLCGRAALFHWTDYVFPPVGRRTPTVMTLHDCAFLADPEFHGEDAARLAARTRAAVDRADAIVCPTAATAADAMAWLGISSARVHVIPFGADHALASRGSTRRVAAPYVLMLGTIEPRKNHLRALAAWRGLGPDRPRLVVVGRPGWCCDAAVDALAQATAHDPVTWLRDADDATVAELLSGAAALLYPSLLEGFGFPPLEALRCGVPVVCGDTPALREVGSDVVEFCDPRDVESIQAALVRALGDRSVSANARRAAHAARYTWSACAAAHAALYREVLAR